MNHNTIQAVIELVYGELEQHWSLLDLKPGQKSQVHIYGAYDRTTKTWSYALSATS